MSEAAENVEEVRLLRSRLLRFSDDYFTFESYLPVQLLHIFVPFVDYRYIDRNSCG